jgi:replicative DNA helicase
MTPPAATIREQEISKLSFGLKNMAKEFNIPFVVMSQLNRALEQRPDKRPMLSDLRESGSLEQDADKVIFLHRPAFFNIDYFEDGSPTKNVAEVIVAKNRGGDVGTVRLMFDGHKTKFANY